MYSLLLISDELLAIDYLSSPMCLNHFKLLSIYAVVKLIGFIDSGYKRLH